MKKSEILKQYSRKLLMQGAGFKDIENCEKNFDIWLNRLHEIEEKSRT